MHRTRLVLQHASHQTRSANRSCIRICYSIGAMLMLKLHQHLDEPDRYATTTVHATHRSAAFVAPDRTACPEGAYMP
eukprot:9578856-Alexandrium_andersonii.AAC.1